MRDQSESDEELGAGGGKKWTWLRGWEGKRWSRNEASAFPASRSGWWSVVMNRPPLPVSGLFSYPLMQGVWRSSSIGEVTTTYYCWLGVEGAAGSEDGGRL